MTGRALTRMIIVDDDRLTRQGIAKHLPWHTIGVEVVGLAEHGRAGLSLVEEVEPDVIITDVRMPVMDGIAFIEHLEQRRCPARIIMLSGYRDFDYARQAIRFGVSDYILKPIDERELLHAVERCTGQADSVSPSGEALLHGRDPPPAVIRAIEFVHENYHADITVADVARHVMLHPNYLSTLFSESTGMHCSSYLAQYRVEQAKRLLEEGRLKVYEVAASVGITDFRRFSRTFKKHTGMTPRGFRRFGEACADAIDDGAPEDGRG